MKVATSPEFLESVANDERVHKWVAEDGKPISLAAIWPESIGIEFDTGGFLFQRLGVGVYEVHTLFLPKSVRVYDKARLAAQYMFCATDCKEILTKVPAFNIAARHLTERMWFIKDFCRTKAFAGHDVEYFRLPLKTWMFCESALAVAGKEFHARLEASGKHANHEDDAAHDQAVGYAIATARMGLLDKAKSLYNEWALFAGYEPAKQTKEAGTFSIGDVTVRFSNGEYELCQ